MCFVHKARLKAARTEAKLITDVKNGFEHFKILNARNFHWTEGVHRMLVS